MLNPREYLTCLRINDWLHSLGLAILGIAFYSPASLFTLPAFWGLIISALYLAHGFSLNNCFDAAIDQYIHKKYLPPARTSYTKFLIFSYLLLFINCLMGYFFSRNTIILVICGSILALIYSAPPWRLKKYTAPNIILNSAGFAIIFLIGFIAVGGRITLKATLLTLFFALFFIPLQIIHQISHAQADKLENIPTLINRFGLKTTLHLFCWSLLLLLCWSLLVGLTYPPYLGVFFLTTLFCCLIWLALSRIKFGNEPYPQTAAALRISVRKICILFGSILLTIFYFAN